MAFTMKVSLLLLAVVFCLQKVALADVDPVPAVEEQRFTMGGLSTDRRFLTQSSPPPPTPSYSSSSSCSSDFQCSRQTVDGQKKYVKGGCCKKICVDLLKDDANNCGSCGKKCSYGAVCCSGHCTLIYGKDTRNCGGCGKKCGKGVKCLYGICGYNSGS